MIFNANGSEITAGLALAALLIVTWISLIDLRGPGLYYKSEAKLKQEEDKGLFLQHAQGVEFPSPINYTSIQEVCTQDPLHFRPGLLFSCEGQHGGIGMLRNQMLTCIRYAIHAGAAVVVPSMAKRNPSDITDIETEHEAPMEYLFDRDAFKERLTEGCPGMQLYDRAEDFPNYQQRAGEPLELLGAQFEPDHPFTGLRYPGQWRRFFDEWLNQQEKKISPEAPVHIKMQPAYLEYPVSDDGKAFAYEFGKILSFRQETQALAAKVLYELKRQFSLPIDPSRPINPGAFYGAHLRLEKDAVWAWDPNEWRYSRMKDQFEEQFQYLMRTGLSVVYVASGNETVARLFAEYLDRRTAEETILSPEEGGVRNQGVKVVTKYDLLEGSDREQLDRLTFDQQALVDFLMMFKSSAFMGVAHSSFPWTIALRRHELSRLPGYANEGSDLLRDEYSVIMGMRADYPRVDPFEYGVWP